MSGLRLVKDSHGRVASPTRLQTTLKLFYAETSGTNNLEKNSLKYAIIIGKYFDTGCISYKEGVKNGKN